jgi:hypothetical protein
MTDTSVEAAVGAATKQLFKFLPDETQWDLSRPAAESQWIFSGLVTIWPWPPTVNLAVAEQLIAEAKSGNSKADTILRGAIANLLSDEQPLPLCLARYAADALRAGIKVPPKLRRLKSRGRDVQIMIAVYTVTTDFGFNPTRNHAARDADDAAESACSIVAQALARNGIHMSEDAVEQIWKRLKFMR